MRLYSIRHKHTGLFFLHTNWRGRESWATSPVFWKTADGVARTLRRLGSDFEPKQSRYRPSRPENWENFRVERLSNIEVIITDVSILGEQVMAAADFFNTPSREPSPRSANPAAPSPQPRAAGTPLSEPKEGR